MDKQDDVQSSKETTLGIVIPLYNSEATILPLVKELIAVLGSRYCELEIVLVNDGSPDDTHRVALEAHARFPDVVRYVKLARNFGEHNAVMCGLHYTTADCVAIIDDDFQNPPSEIPILVDKLLEGYDVVYSSYACKQHHWFRNLGSRFNDWAASLLLSKPKGLYLSSFKVLNRFLVRSVINYSGPYPYLDGLVLRTTRSIASVQVRHAERSEGRSNYTLRRLIRLWLNMFTGFSIVPLRIASIVGGIMSVSGFFLALFFIASWYYGGILFRQPIPPGWASVIVIVVVFSGLQLSMLGVLGEYLGRLFLTQSRTPQFVVREEHLNQKGEAHDATES